MTKRMIHKYKTGTFELWASFSQTNPNLIIVKEDGKTEFMYSDGSWDTNDWDRRGYIEQNSWPEEFEFLGYL